MILPWTQDSSLCNETNEYANTSSVEYQVFVISADCISGERTETKVQRLARKKKTNLAEEKETSLGEDGEQFSVPTSVIFRVEEVIFIQHALECSLYIVRNNWEINILRWQYITRIEQWKTMLNWSFFASTYEAFTISRNKKLDVFTKIIGSQSVFNDGSADAKRPTRPLHKSR